MLVNYLDRMVDSEKFRAFVYHKDGYQRLAESWKEYLKLIDSGEWFSQLSDVPAESKPRNQKRKIKDGDNGS